MSAASSWTERARIAVDSARRAVAGTRGRGWRSERRLWRLEAWVLERFGREGAR